MKLHRLFRHVASGKHYVVRCADALLEKEGTEGPRYVVYTCLLTNITWIRPEHEFYDGRFVSIGDFLA